MIKKINKIQFLMAHISLKPLKNKNTNNFPKLHNAMTKANTSTEINKNV
jgi:hypothetical protein